MNAIPWRWLPAAYRDHFGVHSRPGRALAGLLQGIETAFERASAALRRRVTFEEGVWLLIGALVLAFLMVLVIVGGHGGTGR